MLIDEEDNDPPALIERLIFVKPCNPFRKRTAAFTFVPARLKRALALAEAAAEFDPPLVDPPFNPPAGELFERTGFCDRVVVVFEFVGPAPFLPLALLSAMSTLYFPFSTCF